MSLKRCLKKVFLELNGKKITVQSVAGTVLWLVVENGLLEVKTRKNGVDTSQCMHSGTQWWCYHLANRLMYAVQPLISVLQCMLCESVNRGERTACWPAVGVDGRFVYNIVIKMCSGIVFGSQSTNISQQVNLVPHKAAIFNE